MSTSMSGQSPLQAEEPPVQMQEGRRVCVCSRKSQEAGVAGGARNFDEIWCLARSCGPPGY